MNERLDKSAPMMNDDAIRRTLNKYLKASEKQSVYEIFVEGRRNL